MIVTPVEEVLQTIQELSIFIHQERLRAIELASIENAKEELNRIDFDINDDGFLKNLMDNVDVDIEQILQDFKDLTRFLEKDEESDLKIETKNGISSNDSPGGQQVSHTGKHGYKRDNIRAKSITRSSLILSNTNSKQNPVPSPKSERSISSNPEPNNISSVQCYLELQAQQARERQVEWFSKDIRKATKDFLSNEVRSLELDTQSNPDLKRYFEAYSLKFAESDLFKQLRIILRKWELDLVAHTKPSNMTGMSKVNLPADDQSLQVTDICVSDRHHLSNLTDSKVNTQDGIGVAVLQNLELNSNLSTAKLAVYRVDQAYSGKKPSQTTLDYFYELTYDLNIHVMKGKTCTVLGQKPCKYIVQIPVSQDDIILKHFTIDPYKSTDRIKEDHSVQMKTESGLGNSRVKLSQDGNWSAVLLGKHSLSVARETDTIDSSFKYTVFSDLVSRFQAQEQIEDLYLDPVPEEGDGPSLVITVLTSLQYVYLVRVFARFDKKKRDYTELQFDVIGKFPTKIKSEQGLEGHTINGIAADCSKNILFIVSNFQYDTAHKFTNYMTENIAKREVFKGPKPDGDNDQNIVEYGKLQHPSTASKRIVMLRSFQLQGNLMASKAVCAQKNITVIGSFQGMILWPAFSKQDIQSQDLFFYTNRDKASAVDVAVFGIKGFYNLFAAEYSKMSKGEIFSEDYENINQRPGIDIEACGVYYDFDTPITSLNIRTVPSLRSNILNATSVAFRYSRL